MFQADLAVITHKKANHSFVAEAVITLPEVTRGLPQIPHPLAHLPLLAVEKIAAKDAAQRMRAVRVVDPFWAVLECKLTVFVLC